MTPVIKLIGVDPGFALMGLALLEVDVSTGRCAWVATELIQTAPSPRRVRAYATDDLLRRAEEIARRLERVIELWASRGGVFAACVESFSPPRNSSAASKVAMAWGALVAIASQRGIPVLQVSPQGLKLALTGDKSASKGDIAAAVEARVTSTPAEQIAKIPRSKREHVYDAAAAAIACMGSDAVRLAMRRSA
jgi:Holliday junction resolvasome RuvABC endonuclease subunit